MSEIKRCPCCGSDEVRIERDDFPFTRQNYSDRYPRPVATQAHGYRVKCPCGLSTCWWHYEHEAVAAWDRRPPTNQEGGE